MSFSSLSDRIKYIAEIYFEGNRTAFAKHVGVSASTFNRQLAARDEKNLAKQCAPILAAMPYISSEWLSCGKGEPPARHETASSPVCNKKGKHIGGLLDVALDFYDISHEEVEKYAGISPQILDDVLSGHNKPNFEFMENLYTAFGINPAYLFHCDERAMRDAKEPIERAFQAIGKFSRYPVAYYELEELFGASEEEAREYADAYRQWKADMKACAQSAKPLEPASIPESPNYPGKWLYDFVQQVTVNLAWLDNPNAPPFRLKTRAEIQKEIDQSQNDGLRKRIGELETLLSGQGEEVKSLQEELAIARKEIIRLQGQLLQAVSGNPDFSHPTGLAAAGTGVASGAREDGD